MLTSRILPQDEWGRLQGTELTYLASWPEDQPHAVVVYVVEDGDQILACWARMTTEHVEGVWVSPEAGAGAVRRLLATMLEGLQADGLTQVLTQSLTPEVDALLERLGAAPLPGRVWLIPIPVPVET